jgi:hypothetical protein
MHSAVKPNPVAAILVRARVASVGAILHHACLSPDLFAEELQVGAFHVLQQLVVFRGERPLRLFGLRGSRGCILLPK